MQRWTQLRQVKCKHGKPGPHYHPCVLTHNWYTKVGHSSETDPMPFGVRIPDFI